ncbi:MAG: LicD family protein [Raoultibacter sp.]
MDSLDKKREYLTLQQLQSVALELLLDFDAFCKGHGVSYALCGGSMLGAARHQGFIPWDDDIDVMLLRSEYDKLLSLAPEASLDGNHALVSVRDKTFARDYARYIRKDFGKEEDETTEEDCPWIGVDIFPIDFISDSDELFVRQLRDRRFWHELVVTCSSPFNAGSTFVKKWVRNIIRPFAFAYGRFRAAEKSEAICKRFNDSPGRDIAIVCGMYGTKERWSSSGYQPLIEVPFEGHLLPAPHDFDAYLSAIYGDYMQLPPENKRKPSHIRAWKL